MKSVRCFTAVLLLASTALAQTRSAGVHFRRAIELKKLEKLDEAEAALRSALKLRPGFEQAGLMLGLLLQQKGKPDQAISQYRTVLKHNPKSAEAHNFLGVALLQQNQLPAAIEAFRKAVALQPAYVRAYNNLGSTYAQQGDLAQGIAAFEKGLQYAPDDTQLRINLGIAYRTRGDSDRALEHFQRVLKQHPRNPDLHLQIAQTLRQKGEVARAVESFETALEIEPEMREAYYGLGLALKQLPRAGRAPQPCAAPDHPDCAATHIQRGYQLGQSGDLAAALQHLEKAAAMEPAWDEARYNLAVALWLSGNRDRARTEVAEALRLNPASAEAYAFQGLTLRDTAGTAEARRTLQRAIALNGRLPAPYLDLGLIYLRARRYEPALGHFEAALNLPAPSLPDAALAARELRAAIDKVPDRAAAHHVLGRLLGVSGADAREVIAAFEQAIRLRPDYAEAHNHLGLVYTQLNDDPKAIAAYREALRLRPDYTDARINLGAVLVPTDPAEAVKHLEQAVAAAPDSVRAQYNLAMAYGASAAHGGAKEIEQLRKVLALDPQFPRARFALGRALLRSGQINEALGELEQAVRLEPSYGEAHYQLGLALSRAGRQQEGRAAIQKGREMVAADQRRQTAALDFADARAALENGDYQLAIDKLTQVLKAQPDAVEARRLLEAARAKTGGSSRIAQFEDYIRRGQFKEVEPLLAAFVKDEPNSAWGWYALGYTQYAQQKIGESIASLARSLQLDLSNAEAHKMLGRNLMLIGRFEEAELEFRQAVRLKPDSAEIRYNLGKLYLLQDNYAPAREQLEAAVRLEPAYMEAHDSLGFALEALGEEEKAVAAYLRSVELSEQRKASFAAPLVNLAAYYNRVEQPDRALEYARKAVAVNERSDRAWFQVGRALERRKELEPAVDALTRAIALNGKVASYHYVLATVYRRLGKSAESRQAMESFARLDKESTELEQKRREALQR